MSDEHTPFPLEGGRAGDGGGTSRKPRGRPATGSVSRARRFRKEPTLAERILWKALRPLQMNFRRQVPIGDFIIDFGHHQSKLLIEVDGYYHTVAGAPERDAARTAYLNAEGYRVIRFNEKAVRDDVDAVVRQILAEALSPPSPTLPPSRGKGEEASRA